MTLAPLLAEPVIIVAHAGAAALAFLLGCVQLVGPKGTGLHRRLGWLWAAAMTTVAATSFGIHTMPQIGPFSWIHGLSIVVLVTVPLAIHAARRGRRASHRAQMLSLFFLALVLTGAFTLLPGRVMHAVVFGG